jgi:hypothetical protein
MEEELNNFLSENHNNILENAMLFVGENLAKYTIYIFYKNKHREEGPCGKEPENEKNLFWRLFEN